MDKIVRVPIKKVKLRGINKTISIDNVNEDEGIEVDAVVYRDILAFHRMLLPDWSWSKRYYTITHVPTGLAIKLQCSKSEVKETIKDLMLLNWNPETEEDYQKLLKMAKNMCEK